MQNVSAAGTTVVLPGSICGCVRELRAAAGSAFIRLKAGSLRFCELSGAGGEPTRRGAGRVRELQSRTWRAMHDAASVLCVVCAAAPFVKVLVTASAVHAAEGRGRAWWFRWGLERCAGGYMAAECRARALGVDVGLVVRCSARSGLIAAHCSCCMHFDVPAVFVLWSLAARVGSQHYARGTARGILRRRVRAGEATGRWASTAWGSEVVHHAPQPKCRRLCLQSRRDGVCAELW